MKRRFTCTIEKRGRWYIGYVNDLPGANTQGRSVEEVRDNLKEAILLVLTARKQIAERETPPEQVIHEKITVDA